MIDHLGGIRTTRLVDVVFPGDTNHHGTLFGGVGLACMDKVAFIAAGRHAHVSFVTASCERVDFKAPANLGDIIEFSGRVCRVGRRSLSTEVEMVAEEALSGRRRLCGRSIFNMVAVGADRDMRSPQLSGECRAEPADLRMVELVFPEQTSHYGSLYGGTALGAMAKAAFIAATRHCRRSVVLASVQRVDLASQIDKGEVMELAPRVIKTGQRSITVEVELWSENLVSGCRQQCGTGTLVMVALESP